MKVKQYDTVLLKDGRKASIVEEFDGKDPFAVVGNSEKDWKTITLTIDDIDKVLTDEH